jgi:hypothetical protein
MTDQNVVTLKLIQALIEAIEIKDEDDAKAAIRTIRGLLGAGKQS